MNDHQMLLRDKLAAQRSSFGQEATPSLAVRRDRLSRCIDLLVRHEGSLVEAMADDFGHRPRDMSRYVDIVSSLKPLRHARKHVKSWMRDERTPSDFPLGLLGGRSVIRHEPKGVVGLISPWNFPVYLTFAPLAGILAAGNRCLIKPSELTPQTSALMGDLIADSFDAAEVAVVTGGAEVGQAFSELPFDHLIFTGSTSVGRHVMRAAANNLVPVTLELGGKSPTVIGNDANLRVAAERIVVGKMMNAGQICLAPDYVLVERTKRDALIAEIARAAREFYPTLLDNLDYGSIINERHHDRLQSLVDEARSADVLVVDINPAQEDFSDQMGTRKMPLQVVVDPGQDLSVMQDEIFGPVLPVCSYDHFDEVIRVINGKPPPLALYYFGSDDQQLQHLLDQTSSGGVTVNDVIFHVAQEHLPFGGIGPSGMGTYHGHAGFLEFSHARAVYRQTGFDIARLAGLKPPYGRALSRLLKWELRG